MSTKWSPNAVPKMNGTATQTVRRLPTELPGAITAQQLQSLYQYTTNDFSDVWTPTIYKVENGKSCLSDNTCISETNTDYSTFEYCSWIDSTKTNMAARSWMIESFQDVESIGNAGIDKGAATPTNADTSYEPTPTVTMPTTYKIQSPLTNFMYLSSKVFKVKKPTTSCENGIWKLVYDDNEAQSKNKLKWVCDTGSSESGGSGGSGGSGSSSGPSDEKIKQYADAWVKIVDADGNDVVNVDLGGEAPELYLAITVSWDPPDYETLPAGRLSSYIVGAGSPDGLITLCFGENCSPETSLRDLEIKIPDADMNKLVALEHTQYIPLKYATDCTKSESIGRAINIAMETDIIGDRKAAVHFNCSPVTEDKLELQNWYFTDYYGNVYEDNTIAICPSYSAGDVCLVMEFKNRGDSTIAAGAHRKIVIGGESIESTDPYGTVDVQTSEAVEPGLTTSITLRFEHIETTADNDAALTCAIYEKEDGTLQGTAKLDFKLDCPSSSSSSSSTKPTPGGCTICDPDDPNCKPIITAGGTYVELSSECLGGEDAGRVKLTINDSKVSEELEKIPVSVKLTGAVTGEASSLTDGGFVVDTTMGTGCVNSVILEGAVVGDGEASDGSITIFTEPGEGFGVNSVVLEGDVTGDGEASNGSITITTTNTVHGATSVTLSGAVVGNGSVGENNVIAINNITFGGAVISSVEIDGGDYLSGTGSFDSNTGKLTISIGFKNGTTSECE